MNHAEHCPLCEPGDAPKSSPDGGRTTLPSGRYLKSRGRAGREAISRHPGELDRLPESGPSHPLPRRESPSTAGRAYGKFFDCFEQLKDKELSSNNIIEHQSRDLLIGEIKKSERAISRHTIRGVPPPTTFCSLATQAFADRTPGTLSRIKC